MEKGNKSEELITAVKDLAFQYEEKEKRAAELVIANAELVFQNEEKGKRAAELVAANKELVFQNEEKGMRAAELVAANKELVAFNYISSHDLQEPLRKIQSFSALLLEKEHQNLSDSGKRYCERIRSAAERMQQLIEDLLAYSRINVTDRIFEETDLNTIIDQVRSDLKEAIEEKNAIIEVAELSPAYIIPFQFCQLLHNLIGNALKFSKPGMSPHIIIQSKNAKGNQLNNVNLLPEREYSHIIVKDNGIGFEQEYSERIFVVFNKLHNKEDYAGTGIGLAIVRKIIENHNGLVVATGEIDKGATFDIYIPAER